MEEALAAGLTRSPNHKVRSHKSQQFRHRVVRLSLRSLVSEAVSLDAC